MKKGLVLEGGAMRGLFTSGIIDVMMEAGIEPDGLIGVSAGAAFGCNYKSRQPGRAIRYNTRFARDKRYCSWQSWWKTGDLYNAEFGYHIIPTQFDIFDNKAFEENPMEFYAVCTDVQTGEAVYKRLMECDYDCYEYIRASASMPLVSRIVRVGDELLLDGSGEARIERVHHGPPAGGPGNRLGNHLQPVRVQADGVFRPHTEVRQARSPALLPEQREKALRKGPLLIEWADRIREILPEECLWIQMKYISEGIRSFTLKPTGKRYTALTAEFRRQCFGV